MFLKTFRSFKFVFITFFLTLITFFLTWIGQKRDVPQEYSSVMSPGVPSATADVPLDSSGDSAGGPGDSGTDCGTDCSGGP